MRKHRRIAFFLVFLPATLGMVEAGHAGFYDCNICHDPHGDPNPTFHDAEHLVCSKCHTMHYSEDGTVPPDADAGGPFGALLLKSNATDVCLICHQAPLNNSGAPIVLTPDGTMGTNYPSLASGDFYYSKTDAGKGHNPGGAVIGSDGVLTQSPGGGFAAADEICTDCHEPHGGGPANTYRLLKKKPGNWAGSDLLVTGEESHAGSDETETNAPEYHSGFSAWCAACHGGFHGSDLTDPDVGDNTSWIRHPNGRVLGNEIAGNYGASYDWQHPVEDVDANGTVSSTDKVLCLSCHRVHGTPYRDSTRWDSTQPSGANTGCNKCHAKGS